MKKLRKNWRKLFNWKSLEIFIAKMMLWSEVDILFMFKRFLMEFCSFFLILELFNGKLVIFNANLRRKFPLLCLDRNLSCFSKFVESYYPNFWLLVEESRKCMNVKLKLLNDLLGLKIKRIKEYSSFWTSFHIFRQEALRAAHFV